MRRTLIVIGMLMVTLGTYGVAAAQGPALTVTGPVGGATLMDDKVVVNFEVTDFTILPSSVPLEEAGKRPDANRPGEGHVHLMLDLQPVVVWEQMEPYTFSGVLPGDHLLMVELVNNDHSSLTPPVVQQIQFRSEAPAVMPTTGGAPALASLWLAALGLLVAVSSLALQRRTRTPG